MPHYLISILLSLTAIMTSAEAAVPIKTHVELRIHGRPDTEKALLYEADSDIHMGIINVYEFKDSMCSFNYTSDVPREMEIIFYDEITSGSWKHKRFYAEGDTVRGVFHSYEMNHNDSIVSRGRLQSMKDSLAEAETEACKELPKATRDLYYLQERLRFDYLTDSEPSLFGLMEIRRLLKNESRRHNVDSLMERLQVSFDNKYAPLASHPYYDQCKQMFAIRQLKPGKHYRGDYTIHAADGSEALMADLIKGRTAIIDLWASWCLPCRSNSKALIPIYEKYMPKGLVYVAVAREIGDAKSMQAASKEDGFPWQSYVDINDADGIWDKNGCPQAGGRIFLIDSEGIIVAINPSAEEIERYLENKFSADD